MSRRDAGMIEIGVEETGCVRVLEAPRFALLSDVLLRSSGVAPAASVLLVLHDYRGDVVYRAHEFDQASCSWLVELVRDERD